MQITNSLPEPTTRQGGVWLNFLCWGIGLFALYLLSTGPVVKLVCKGVINYHYAEAVYAPLIWLSDNCEPLEESLEWYVAELWDNP